MRSTTCQSSTGLPRRGAARTVLLALALPLLAGCAGTDSRDMASLGAPPSRAEATRSSMVMGIRSNSPRTAALRPARSDSSATDAYRMVNDERLRRGMPALVRRGDLDAVAFAHAKDLVRMNRLSHVGSNGSHLENRLARVQWIWAGENLARNKGFDTPSVEAVKGWINSRLHYENMFRPDFTHTGMAAVYDPDSEFTYFVQVFITPP